MQIVLVLFVQVLRFVPLTQYDVSEWNVLCGAHSIEKLDLKYSTATSLPEEEVSSTDLTVNSFHKDCFFSRK